MSLNKQIFNLLSSLQKQIVKSESFTGMCIELDTMMLSHQISFCDYMIIRKLLAKNKPKKTFDRYYWWKEGSKTERIEFLENLKLQINY